MLRSKKRFKFTSETELALPVVNWLKSQGWEVYKEVKPRRLEGIADIVAVKDDKIWVVETKLIYGTKVLEQANRWKGYADFVSVAVPKPQGKNVVLDYFAQGQGIGIFWVSHVTQDTFYVHANKSPRLNEKILKEVIKECLREEQKDSTAGASGGGYVTSYKITIQKIKNLLKEKGPLTIQNIVDSIDHHYASRNVAIQTLKKHLFKYEKDFILIRDFDKDKIALKPSKDEDGK